MTDAPTYADLERRFDGPLTGRRGHPPPSPSGSAGQLQKEHEDE